MLTLRDAEKKEHSHYHSYTLRHQRPWPRAGVEYVAVPPRPTDMAYVVRDPEDATTSDVALVTAIVLAGELGVVNRRTSSGVALECANLKAHRTLATLRLDGATAASMRLADNVLTIGDDRGRLIVFDAGLGVVRRDLRTS